MKPRTPVETIGQPVRGFAAGCCRLLPATAGLLLALAATPAGAQAGRITATLGSDNAAAGVKPVQTSQISQVKAVGRKNTPAGVKKTVTKGRVNDNKVIVKGLSVPATYSLRFELKSGAVVQGWNAKVPESDYVNEWPLEQKAKETIFKKMLGEDFAAFWDRIKVLDVAGNAQHAAVLVERIRRREFVTSDYQEGEWVWRVDRFHWESPQEGQWVPYQEMPFYAIVRKRFFEKDYAKQTNVYARQLGGIKLTSQKTTAELGNVVLPEPEQGVYAVKSTGEKIETRTLKGKEKAPDESGN